jgi:oligopeptide transport system substrate-binding protein
MESLPNLMAKIASFLIALCLIVLSSCGPQNARLSSRASDTLYRVNDDEMSSLDPQKVSTVLDTRVLRDMFEGLTDYAPDGKIVGGFAKSWSVDATGLRWTFQLRDGVIFSDGTAITATEIIASFQRLFKPETAAPNANLLFSIQNAEAITSGKLDFDKLGISAPNSRTILIQLVQPFPALPELLAHACASIVPIHIIKQHGDAWTKIENIVVSGAYVPNKWELHSELNLVKNPRYWAQASVKTAKIAYYPISDDQTALRKFRAKEVDILTDFPTDKYPDLVKLLGPAVRTSPYRGTYYYVFNTRKKPFSDVRIRQALSLGVDRDVLRTLILPLNMAAAYSVVPEITHGYGATVTPSWMPATQAVRVAKAKTLLTQAGYGPHNPLTVELRFNTDDDHRRTGLALAQMWKPLGIKTTLFNSEAAVHFGTLRAHNFMLGRSGWIADYDGAENYLGMYRSNAGTSNYSGYTNAEFDALYAKALLQADLAQRNAMLRIAEMKMLESAPVLPLYFYVTKAIVSPRVKGWMDAPNGVHLSKYLSVIP